MAAPRLAAAEPAAAVVQVEAAVQVEAEEQVVRGEEAAAVPAEAVAGPVAEAVVGEPAAPGEVAAPVVVAALVVAVEPAAAVEPVEAEHSEAAGPVVVVDPVVAVDRAGAADLTRQCARTLTSPGCDSRLRPKMSDLMRGILVTLATVALSVAASRQRPPAVASIPSDPLEMATGQIRPIQSADERTNILQLLERARASYSVRSAGQPYDLTVSFKVNSGGQTAYDGAWKMEDWFHPKQGERWTAQSPGDFSITRISSNGRLYDEVSASYIPLRLQEARAALFDPLPSAENLARASIRTTTAIYDGAQLTCVLLSGPGNAANAASSRRWDEAEECIDPQSGLLSIHSPVPGRYNAYDYTEGPKFAGHVLPRKVTITEGGQTVTEISVDSLSGLTGAGSDLFLPTERMKQQGRAVSMEGAQKLWRMAGRGVAPRGTAADAVCVFGVVTPSGQLVEAHSLQPSDPNSPAALAAAKQIDFSHAAPLGGQPQQHFVFIIEQFVAGR